VGCCSRRNLGSFRRRMGHDYVSPHFLPASRAVRYFPRIFLLSRYWDGKSRDQRAIMTATIEHQRVLLAVHREKEETFTEKFSEIVKRPDFKVLMMGANIFVPTQEKGWSGIALQAKIWNVGAPSVVVSWSLTIITPGQTPVIAQLAWSLTHKSSIRISPAPLPQGGTIRRMCLGPTCK
jgi:hypothetical protein